jgi:hypothetical protein
MLDESSSGGSDRSQWIAQKLRSVREYLQRVEIDVHQLKASVAQLEATNEAGIADELSAKLHGVEATADTQAAKIEPSNLESMPRRKTAIGEQSRFAATNEKEKPAPQRSAVTSAVASAATITAAKQNPSKPSAPFHSSAAQSKPRKKRRKVSSAWSLSLALHAGILMVLAPMTFVMVTQDRIPLFASMFETSSELDTPGMAPVELVSFEEFEVASDVVEQTAAIAETFDSDFTPLDSAPGGEVAESLGQLNTMPTDVGTLMAGGGGGKAGPLGGGRRGAAGDEARLGMTSFFGSQAKANRVVFLVDNSGSMKHGRMETTLFELARSIESLSKEQEFYVVFYSDRAYPMLYPNSEMKPLAATPENKQKLFAWLQTVELCSGGALLKAVDIAESLDPHVVYVLSDGDITSSNTLSRLTTAGNRTFAIHTLGMGVAKPQDAQNLLAIAQANRGTFQMVRPLPAAVQMAKARPIRSNGFGVSWGEAALPPLR